MNENKVRERVMRFVSDWNGRGNEKSDAQMFWSDLLSALGLDNISRAVDMEREVVVNNHTCFIDVFIRPTRVLIEQKSRGIDLDKAARQSDGSFLTPYEQAKRYADALPYSQRPRWIVTCNFDEIRIYDLDRLPSNVDDTPDAISPRIITFNHLTVEYKHLMFLVDPNDDNIDEVKISIDAVKIIETIRDAFARKMLAPRRPKGDPVEQLSVDQRNSLNRFCVRLVFCLYAEDASIFAPNQFTDYLKHSSESDALLKLFDTLNTPIELRAESLSEELLAFPYVNGDLFSDAALDVPALDHVTSSSITLNAADNRINWFAINPTIFGALFESNLSDDTRRSGGMHFTSRANIHRLIDPLFLDELHDEFKSIRRKRKNKIAALEAFQDRLARLIFFDPACGSGNFLTETFISLRQLENKILGELINLGAPCTVKVSIDQFFGIEINGFACAIAQTAMQISEHKMLCDTDVGIRDRIEYLPLKHSARIVCGNALTLDWRDVVPEGVDYIIGNPPFVGKSFQTPAQKADMVAVFDGVKGCGNLDYVACWFKRAADFMIDTETRAAFVSTNSICQGIAVPPLWKYLFDSELHIDFAHRTFKWINESENKAAVHCVIVGFSHAPSERPRIIFDGDKKIVAGNINAYLLDAPNIIIEDRAEALSNVPRMSVGSCPTDGGGFIIDADEYEDFVRREPRAQKYIRRYMGGDEFINAKPRWCLWLKDVSEEEIISMPLVAARVEAVRQFRLASKKMQTKRRALTPTLFAEDRYVGRRAIFVPMVSSGLRRYVPMGFIDADVVANNKALFVADGGLYEFGVMESSVHMAWMRVLATYLGTSYSYSATIMYNNFVWAEATEAQRLSIEASARKILEARAQYPDWTLASLYNESSMPSELRSAHVENDRRVMDLYGFDESMSEAEIVSQLMELYQRLRSE